MKHLYVLGAVLGLAACAQQTAPPPAAMAPPPAPPPMAMAPPPGPPPMVAAMEPLDGVYVGSLTLQAAGLSGDSLNRSGCVSGRAASAAVRRGIINIEYANWKLAPAALQRQGRRQRRGHSLSPQQRRQRLGAERPDQQRPADRRDAARAVQLRACAEQAVSAAAHIRRTRCRRCA